MSDEFEPLTLILIYELWVVQNGESKWSYIGQENSQGRSRHVLDRLLLECTHQELSLSGLGFCLTGQDCMEFPHL